MYNDIVMITLCVFAVYGVYALFREISMLFSRKIRVFAAVRINSKMSKDERNDALLAAENFIHYHSFLERAPIIINEGVSSQELKKYGYKIYELQTEEE